MKKGERKIKAIIFDIGGVLQLGEKQRKKRIQKHASGVHEYIAKKLKIDLDQYFDAIDTYYTKSIEGKISEKELTQTIAKNLNVSPRRIVNLYDKAYGRTFALNKQLFKQALKLKKEGHRIAILSDQWHLSKRIHIPRIFYKEFEEVVVSCDVGMRKPSPEIYKLTLKKMGLKPSETIFIDNQKWNTQPAEKLGMKTILFKNNEQLFKHPLWKKLFE